jgi:threonine/homoserine/homoserine lactone efflux protein
MLDGAALARPPVFSSFLQGLVLGFSIAVPVGPIGLLCIRRSLSEGRRAGFVSGLGAATADALYGVVAALGLTVITSALLDHQVLLQIGGGVFLVYLGIATLRTRPAAEAATAQPAATGLLGAYLSTLVLTLANPMTILSFLGMFTALGFNRASGLGPASLLVTGVFLGSAAWWLLLSTVAGWLGRRMQQGGLRALNIVSGLIIAGFGLWQLGALVQTLR